MMISVTNLNMEAWRIIRKHDLVQKNFALNVSVGIYNDDQPTGEVKDKEELVRICYEHTDHPLQILAVALESDPTLALRKFEAEIIQASRQVHQSKHIGTL